MPELPDVEVFKRYLDATSLHQEIEEVEVYSRQVLEDVSEGELREGLVGWEFESTHRHGKWLFTQLDDGDWLVLHFGMTGFLKYFKDEAKEPEHDRLLIWFSNGYHLAYDSQRKLGEIDLIEDVGRFVSEHDLGPDALRLTLDEFREVLAGRRGMIKSALMDQSLIAGIGNVYSDEILFHAGIHPRAQVSDLSAGAVEALYHTMQDVLDTTIEHQADPQQFPDDYLTPRRDEGASCPKCEDEIERVQVAGRHGYYCPTCQGEVA